MTISKVCKRYCFFHEYVLQIDQNQKEIEKNYFGQEIGFLFIKLQYQKVTQQIKEPCKILINVAYFLSYATQKQLCFFKNRKPFILQGNRQQRVSLHHRQLGGWGGKNDSVEIFSPEVWKTTDKFSHLLSLPQSPWTSNAEGDCNRSQDFAYTTENILFLHTSVKTTGQKTFLADLKLKGSILPTQLSDLI